MAAGDIDFEIGQVHVYKVIQDLVEVHQHVGFKVHLLNC